MTGWLVRDAVAGGLAGAIVGGAPSTLHALLTGRDPLAASYAAGRMVLPSEQRPARLLAAAVLAHGALSLGWAVPIAAATPPRRAALFGAAAGLAVAALDLGVVGRRIPAIRALPQGAQVADHVAYGVVVALVCARRRVRRG
ncbi:hypothetical protein [Nocardioides vastitatis]|uniref:DUF1440 domain-containing protein n=1 Tax=Nocardioides vastitatis TaxID=2568655 RepID=A0ABW0ZIQ1_9ACTN